MSIDNNVLIVTTIFFMAKYGYISEAVAAGRIVAHGKITDLSSGFKLPKGGLFSVYVRPKTTAADNDVILSVKCYQDEEFGDAPFPVGDWSPLLLREIASDSTVLSDYDIYYGTQDYIYKD